MEIGGERSGDRGIIKGNISGIVNRGVVSREIDGGVVVRVRRWGWKVRIALWRTWGIRKVAEE